VQANATLALARRGSERVRIDLIEVMLDPQQMREIFVIKPRGGKEKPNEALVVQVRSPLNAACHIPAGCGG
jgi:hypothetical protein